MEAKLINTNIRNKTIEPRYDGYATIGEITIIILPCIVV